MLLLAVVLAPLKAAAQVVPDAPYAINRTVVTSVTAPGGDSYRVFASWPEGTPPPKGWPVLYVLDGDDNFAIAVLTARRLARATDRSGVSSGIVVGIDAGPLPRRVRDYTPSTPGWTIPAGQPASGLATGGSDAFLDMLDKQVLPYVRHRWRVDTTRETLLGHSFGGLLALHATLTRPSLFDKVVSVSPSLWFGDGLIAREAAKAGGRHPILIAEGDQPIQSNAPSNASPARLVEQLNAGQATGGATFLPLPGQSHGTTMLAAMAPAITFAFKDPKR